MPNIKQIPYKPKKEKVTLIEPPTKITGQQVLEYLGDQIWKQRVFILVTIVIVENVFLLVRMR